MVSLFVDDGDLKTNEEKFMKKCLVYFKCTSYKLVNSFLPMHRGGNHQERCLEFNLILSNFAIMRMIYFFRALAKANEVLL